MAQETIIISEQQNNFSVRPIIKTANTEAIELHTSAEQIKRKKVCDVYQTFQDNFKMAQKEKSLAKQKAYSAQVQQQKQKPFWQRKNT